MSMLLLNPKKSKMKFRKFYAKNITINRNGMAINPIAGYNVTGATTISANTLVTHGDYAYVGGDTEYLTYDFGLKVAGSVYECPMKVYRTANSTLLVPSDLSWGEEQTQSYLDSLKTQDNSSYTKASIISGNIVQTVIELDLTPICNALFSGSNSALKSALKDIQIDVWASGSGSNAGVLANGAKMQIWNSYSNAWYLDGVHTGNVLFPSSIIEKKTISPTPFTDGKYYLDRLITSSNKLYILIASQYSSDGTIASSVSLDYIKVSIQLSRQPDVVTPISVNLPRYWAIVGDIATNWDSSNTVGSAPFSLGKDSANQFIIFWSTGQWFFNKKINGVDSIINPPINAFSKYQYSRYVVGQSDSGLFMYFLINNGTMKKVSNTDINELKGIMQLRLLVNYTNTNYGNAFADQFTILDLSAIGKPTGFTDAEAELMLRGLSLPSTNEMVVNGDFSNGGTGWALAPTASVVSGQLVLNATAGGQVSTQNISVIPNSQYNIKCTIVGGGKLLVKYMDVSSATIGYSSPITNLGTIITPSNCFNIQLRLDGDSAGTFTFDNISIKYVPPINPMLMPNKELFDINAVVLNQYATISNGIITLNAPSILQSSYIDVLVLPNNVYEIKANIAGGVSGNGAIRVDEYYNNIEVAHASRMIDMTTSANKLTVSSKTNKLRLNILNYAVGTFTFSNISLKLKM